MTLPKPSELWWRIRGWRGWLWVLMAIGVAGGVAVMLWRSLMGSRVVQSIKKVKVPKPEKRNHVEAYRETRESNRRDAGNNHADPASLSDRLASRRRRGSGGRD